MSATQTSVLPLSWDALQSTRQWRALTPQQKVWVLTWLANGRDPGAATQVAYRCSSARNSACLSYEVRRNTNVVAFLELYDVLTQGVPSREAQIAGLLETIRNSPPYVQVRARQLLAELTGCFAKSGQAEEPTTDLQTPEASSPRQVPADALEVWSDPVSGVVIGYRAADGEGVKI